MDLVANTVSFLINERPTYFTEYSSYFLGALLRSIRILATYDLTAAAHAYETYFGPAALWTTGGPYALVPRYTRLYPYLGFRNLERLRLALAGVLPASIKQRLKA